MCRVYPASSPSGGWSMADDTGWLPVVMADYFACQTLAELLAEGADRRLLDGLRDRFNLASPPVYLTAEQLIEALIDSIPVPWRERLRCRTGVSLHRHWQCPACKRRWVLWRNCRRHVRANARTWRLANNRWDCS